MLERSEITEDNKPLYYNVTRIEGSAYEKPIFHAELRTISVQPGWSQKRE